MTTPIAERNLRSKPGRVKEPTRDRFEDPETAEEATESSEPIGREAETSDLLERPGKGNPSVRDEVLKDHSSS